MPVAIDTSTRLRARRTRVLRRLVGVVWALTRAVLIIGLSYVILYPMLVNISKSFMTPRDLVDSTVKWVARDLRISNVVENYRNASRLMDYTRALLNSILLSLVVSSVQVISCSVIGYGLARFRFPGRNLLFVCVIITFLVPPQMMMVPMFLNFRFFNVFGLLGDRGANLLGTFWPFVLTSVTGMGMRNGLLIYIVRQYFRGVSRELEEAAYVDGAGQFAIFTRVMIPNAVPIMIIVFLFSFVWQWNDALWTTTYLGQAINILPVAFDRMMMSSHELVNIGNYKPMMANTGMVLFVAPLLVLYAFLQRHFVESVERAGIVG